MWRSRDEKRRGEEKGKKEKHRKINETNPPGSLVFVRG
jgi:hypothetical protein